MSSLVKTQCPKCKTVASVDEIQVDNAFACASCGSTFIPKKANADSVQQFELRMYLIMILIGVGLFAYMATTGQLQQKRNALPAAPAAKADTDRM